MAKFEKGLQQKSVADAALSQFLVLEARLGRKNELESYLSEIKDRPIHGTVETRITGARQGLDCMKNRPEVAFKCGPFALNSLLYGERQVTACHPVLTKAASTSAGTNLWQLKTLAAQVGLNYQPPSVRLIHLL